LQLVRLPVERPQAAVDFLHARSEGVMDLIAHFWERLSQTPPLQRPDLHLVAALPAQESGVQINISTLSHELFAGAMLYVPKAHRADVLALDSAAAAAFAAYIRHQGPRAVSAERNEAAPAAASGTSNGTSATADTPIQSAPVPQTALTDLSILKGTPAPTALPADPPGKISTIPNGKVPIDFLTGHADGIRWMTPLLLPAVNRKAPAREVVNVVMQLPPEVSCQSDPAVRVAKESDVPTLNRWRRQYKEERGILFDADLDAWVQTQRVFVYEHDKQVVAVAKFDLELPRLIEIGGVYTFPEHRTKGFGAKIVADLACRVRAAGKTPMLQVDEQNASALRIYSAMGWQAMGKLARVWLTG
jgi:GNAT superfamily N-acetyltransferase